MPIRTYSSFYLRRPRNKGGKPNRFSWTEVFIVHIPLRGRYSFFTTAIEFQDALKSTVTQSGIPIIAVDVPSPIFDEMSKNNHWLHDENTLKPSLGSIPAQQLVYINQVRDAVLKKKSDDCKFVVLFSVKEERASLLTF